MSSAATTDAPVSNWNGNYPPCLLHEQVRSTQPLRLAVRVGTHDELLARQFRKALDFWSGVLDLSWREVSSDDCSMQVVDGTPALFDFSSSLSAKAQLPDRPAFQGWIAFNPAVRRSERQMFLDSVHEIGHVLGLPHNSRPSSVMF